MKLAKLLFIAWAMLLAALVIMPLVAPGGLSGAGAAPPLSPTRAARLLGNSLQVGAVAVLVASALAILPGIAAARLSSPRGRRALLALSLVPLLTPGTVLAVVGVRLLGPDGILTPLLFGARHFFPGSVPLDQNSAQLPPAPIFTLNGAGLVLGVWLFPIALAGIVTALRTVDRDAEEAARMDLSPAGALLRVVIPGSLPAALPAGLLVLLLAVTDFAIPEALRSLPVLAADVYVQFGVFYDARAALLSAAVLGATMLILVAILTRLMRRFGLGIEGEIAQVRTIKSDRILNILHLGGWLVTITVAATIPTTLLPNLKTSGGHLHAIMEVLHIVRAELSFSAVTSLAGTALALALGVALGAGLASLRHPLAARLLLLLGTLIPGPVVAVSMKVGLLLPPDSLPLRADDALAWFDGTWGPMLLAWSIRFAPLVALLVEGALRRVPTDVRDAARIDGGFTAALKGFAMGAIVPSVIAAAPLVFALCMGEAGATILLVPPGPTTLSVRLLTLMHFAPTWQVNGMAMILAMPAFLIAAGMALIPGMDRRLVHEPR